MPGPAEVLFEARLSKTASKVSVSTAAPVKRTACERSPCSPPPTISGCRVRRRLAGLNWKAMVLRAWVAASIVTRAPVRRLAFAGGPGIRPPSGDRFLAGRAAELRELVPGGGVQVVHADGLAGVRRHEGGVQGHVADMAAVDGQAGETIAVEARGRGLRRGDRESG